MEISRILQDKINNLTNDELEALGKDYVGQQAIVVWDGNFRISKIESFVTDVITSVIGTKYGGYEIGDKNVKFNFEDGRTLGLLDFAIVGDTLEVMEKGAINEKLMVADIQSDGIINKIEFDNGKKIDYGNMDTIIDKVVPMVQDIGWLQNKQLLEFGIDWKRYDVLDFRTKLYFISGVKKLYGYEEIEYTFLGKNGELETSSFKSTEFDKTFIEKPEVYRLSEDDVFVDKDEVLEISIRKTYMKPKVGAKVVVFRPTMVDYTRFVNATKEVDNFTSTLKEFVEYLLKNQFVFYRNKNVLQNQQNFQAPSEEPKPLDMEGDFIAQFLNNNASNLLELEKNNRPLFDVVEMTLNLLNQKFGKGDSIGEKVDEVIDNAEEMITSVQGKDPNLIGLKEIEVLANEGSPNIKGNKYTSWTEFTDALKPLLEIGVGGYNKVKFKATFDDGKHIIERVDVGENSYNPLDMKVGEYIDRPFGFFDNLDDDLEKYQFDDEIVVTEGGEQETTREDIENEIKALEIALSWQDEQDKIDEINEKINALNITLTLI